MTDKVLGLALINIDRNAGLLATWRTAAEPWMPVGQTTYTQGKPNSLAIFSSLEDAREAYLQHGGDALEVVDTRETAQQGEPPRDPMES